MRLYLAFLLICTFVLGCNNSNQPQPSAESFTSSDFPIHVGNWWTYQHTSSKNGTDTLGYSIIAVQQETAYKKYTCIVTSSQNNTHDTTLIMVSDTAIEFSEKDNVFPILNNVRFRTPYNVGSTWTAQKGYIYSTGADSLLSSQILFGKNYNSVYRVHQFGSSFNYYIRQYVYMAKGVGITSCTIEEQDLGIFYNSHLTLLDYHIEK